MMKKAFIKLSRYTGHFGAALISVVFVIILLVTLGLQSFAVWLTTTDNGADWLSAKLTDLAGNTPYELTLGDFELQGLFGVRARSMSLADKKGVFLEAQNIGIDIDILPIALRRVAVNLNAELMHLERLPEGTEEQAEQSREPLILPERPDAYFNRVVLNTNIESLILDEDVPGGPVKTPLTMVQEIGLEDKNITLDGQISLAAKAVSLPDELNYQISAPWQSGVLSVNKFTATKAEQYDISGAAGWESASGAFDLHVNGTVEKDFHPRLDRQGKIDLSISGTTDDFSGMFSADGVFMDEAFTITTPIKGSSSEITLSDIKGKGYGFTLDGHVIYGFEQDTGLKAEIKADMSSLDLIEALSGTDSLQGQGQLSLVADNGVYSGSGRFTDIIYQNKKLEQLDFTLTPEEDRRFAIDVTLQGPEQEPFSFKATALVDPALRTLDVQNAVLSVDSGKVAMTGLLKPEILDLEIQISDLALAKLPYLDFDMQLLVSDGLVDIQGHPNSPEIEGRATLTGTVIEQQETTISLTGNYKKNQAHIMATAEGRGIETLGMRADIPMQISLYPFAFSADRTAPVSGTAKGDFNLEAVLSPFLNNQQTVQGAVGLNAAITGSLAAPSLNGDISLADGRFYDQANHIFLEDVHGIARLQGNTVTIETLTASDGRDGKIASQGQVDFSAGGLRPDIKVSVTADNMHFLQDSEHNVEIDADLVIESVDDRYLVSGIIMPEEILITLPERFSTNIPELNVVKKDAERRTSILKLLNLDVAIRADKRVFIRGWGLDVEVGGRLKLEGTAATPELRGTLSAIRGRYEEFGKVFEISRANLRFQGTVPPSPYLDILAETDAGSIRAQVIITGPAQEPNLSFSSVPSLPEDEILAQILFGRDTSTISPFQAIQLAGTIRRFSGHGDGLDPLGALRQMSGLDDLRIEGGGDNVTVGAGKYLTDKVYFQVEQGGPDNDSAAVIEVEVTPNVTLESRTGSSGNSGAGVFWEWDY